MTRSGSPYSAPRDANRTPLLTAASSADGVTPVVLEADPITHLLQVSSSGSGGTQYTDGGTPPTHPVGNALEFDNSGTWATVSAANPLPITGTISVGSTIDEAAFTAGTSTTGPIAGVYNDSATALTSGQQGTVRVTANRSLHTTTDNGALETGGNLAAIKTDADTLAGTVSSSKINVNISSGNITGFATAAKQPALGTAGAASSDVISVQGIASMTALKVDGSGVTQPVSAASGAVVSGAFASGSVSDGAMVTLGSKADAKSTATDTTAVTAMQVLKEISYMEQNPASRAVTNAGTFAVQSTLQAGSNAVGTVGTTSAAVNVGQKAVNTTAVQLTVTSTVPTNGIIVGALSTNSASIFIGGSGVTTTTGAEITPGSSLPFTCNLNTLYIISAASTTDKVYWNVT